MGLRRGHRARPGEWIVEKLIQGVGLSTIGVMVLILVFVGREALPVLLGRVNTALIQPILPSKDIDSIPKDTLRSYLELSRSQFDEMDRETLVALMEAREEGFRDIPEAFRADPDAEVNTAHWRHLVLPRRWTGYTRPGFVWQPVGTIHKYNLVPLVVGSLKVTLVGLLFAVPLSLGAALYVSQLAPVRVREWVKPAIELLAGIPSVVLGVFCLLVLSGALQSLLGYQFRLNAFVAGIGLGLTAVPLIFTIAEDSLTGVPRGYVQASLALGASPWQAAWQIVLPAALPGVVAATLLGFGRCLGETMVVLMASGNASTLSWSLFDSTRSMTATIAAEMAEAVSGGGHYRMLFLLGTLLFVISFVTNLLGDRIVRRLRRRLEGRA
ncbi:MAG: phosphate ABC transporter permease subunit PstC [Limisphaerales bacterium]